MGSKQWKHKKKGGKVEIKTVFFDLGGVLVNFSHEKMCANLAQFCQLELSAVRRAVFEDPISEQYEKGVIDSHALHRYFCSLTGSALDFYGLMEAISQIFSPKNETITLLEQLKKQKVSLFLLSNTCEAHFWHIQKQFSFLELFDGVVLSYEVKARKPEKKIYEIALAMANTAAENSFYTDDILEYVKTASEIGIHSHHFQGAEGLSKALKDVGLAV